MSDGAPQIWDIALTPAQRWALTQLAFNNDAPKVTDAAAGKRLRRALRAFGIMQIRDVLRDPKNENKLSDDMANSSAPALHKITAENLECALGWATVARHPALELDAGEVFDLLEAVKKDPAGYTPPDVPAWQAEAENWTPAPNPRPFEITCPSCKQKFEIDEAAVPSAG